jgi:hypothetical protein
MERSLRQYFESEIDLKKTRGANYLAPIIVRKLAHLIDTAIKTSQGFYRPPRRGKIPFRTRPKNPRRATPEQHHIK